MLEPINRLSASDLTFRAGGGEILRVDRLRLAPGAMLAVAGPSGAGKTTLLNLLCALQTPSSGLIRWGETDFNALSAGRARAFRRAYMGLVFQEPSLIDEMTPLQNIAVADRFAASGSARSQDRALALCERLAIPLRRGGRAQAYSRGEKQRIALARALYNAPSILLADEPTASLDKTSATQLTALLIETAQQAGATLICVSHDAALLEQLPARLTLTNGRVTETSGGIDAA